MTPPLRPNSPATKMGKCLLKRDPKTSRKQNSSEIRNNEKEPGKIPVPAIL
jgi:hypothetical protein